LDKDPSNFVTARFDQSSDDMKYLIKG